MELLDTAICFAVKAHSGAVRKETETPYIVYPIGAVLHKNGDVEI